MNTKEILNEIYPLEEYKNLKSEKPICFWITILIPLLLLTIFFYLYFHPFGYQKKYVFTQDNILENRSNFYFDHGQKETNGLLTIVIDPTIGVRNLFGEVCTKGEGVHILYRDIQQEDVLNIWDFETDSFAVTNFHQRDNDDELTFYDYSYSTIDEYDVLDSQTVSFFLQWEPTQEEGEWQIPNQLLLKYKNLRIIQHHNELELRVQEVYDGQIFTYQVVGPIHYESPNELIAIYSRPNGEKNGYIELILNNSRIGREIVTSPYNLFSNYDYLKEYEEPLNDQLIIDFNQERISLGQESYRVDLDTSFPPELLRAVNLDIYYSDMYLSPFTQKIQDGFHPTLSQFYLKPFFSYFRGEINKLKVGYEYPLKTVTNHEQFYGNTPIVLSIAGERENIEEITFTTTRSPIWKNLMSF